MGAGRWANKKPWVSVAASETRDVYSRAEHCFFNEATSWAGMAEDDTRSW